MSDDRTEIIDEICNDDSSFCNCRYDSDLSEISQRSSSSTSKTFDDKKSSVKRQSSIPNASEPKAKIPKTCDRRENIPKVISQPTRRRPEKRTGDPNYQAWYQREISTSSSAATPKRPAFSMRNITTNVDSPFFIPKTPAKETFIRPRSCNNLKSAKSTTSSLSKNQITIPECWRNFMKEKKLIEEEKKEDNSLSQRKPMTREETAAAFGLPKFLIPAGDNHQLPDELSHMKHILINLDYNQASTSRSDAKNSRDYYTCYASDVVKRKESITPDNESNLKQIRAEKSTVSCQSFLSEKSQNNPGPSGKQSAVYRDSRLLKDLEFQKENKADIFELKSSAARKSTPMYRQAQLNEKFLVGPRVLSSTSSNDRKNISSLPSMTDSDEDFDKYFTSQGSIDTRIAKYTARMKEAKAFSLIEGSQFDEEEFLISQGIQDDNVSIIPTTSDTN